MVRAAAVAVACTICFAGTAPAQRPARLDRVPDDPARPVALLLPLNGTIGLVSTLSQIRDTTGAQFGIELLPETAASREAMRRPYRPDKRISLAGMTVDEAASTVVREAPEYTWTRRGAILNVEPIVPFPTPSFLEQRIATFQFADRPMLDALWLFERLFDANAKRMTGMVVGGLETPGADDAARSKAFADASGRKFSVEVRNVSAREVLNAICESHGSLSWQVAYTDDARDYAHARVSLSVHTN